MVGIYDVLGWVAHGGEALAFLAVTEGESLVEIGKVHDAYGDFMVDGCAVD